MVSVEIHSSIMGFDSIGLMNNANAVSVFSVGLLGEKYIKCVSDVFFSLWGWKLLL